MQRVLVVGITGAGKTTLARRLSARLDVPFHEMDDLAFGPGWTTPPDFVQVVSDLVAQDAWVFDSHGYPQVRECMWARADTVVWLDYPRRVTFGRVLRRSLWRTITRQSVFNGNRETLSSWFGGDHPAWHSWTGHAPRRRYVQERLDERGRQHLTVHRFTDPRTASAWVQQVAPPNEPER